MTIYLPSVSVHYDNKQMPVDQIWSGVSWDIVLLTNRSSACRKNRPILLSGIEHIVSWTIKSRLIFISRQNWQILSIVWCRL